MILRKLNKKIEENKERIKTENEAREDPDNKRPEKQETITKLKQELASLQSKIQTWERTDPKKVESLQKQEKEAKDAANRWTDNLFELKDWVKDKNPNFTNSDLEAQFPVLKNLDNID